MSSAASRSLATLDWFVAHPGFVVCRWSEPGLDRCGYDARGGYVELFWLPVLGPSSVLALRRFAGLIAAHPEGAVVDLVEFGASLGIGAGTGRHTQINRTLNRLIEFRFARIDGDRLLVMTKLPPLRPWLRRRLPPGLLDMLTEIEQSRADTA